MGTQTNDLTVKKVDFSCSKKAMTKRTIGQVKYVIRVYFYYKNTFNYNLKIITSCLIKCSNKLRHTTRNFIELNKFI